MTPLCPSCRQNLNAESPSCRYANRHVGKPDSGEREVLCTCGSTNDVHRFECATLAWLRAPPTPYTGPPPMPAGWLAVRTDLAQRILAALTDAWPRTEGERDQLRALAAELRARVEGKA